MRPASRTDPSAIVWPALLLAPLVALADVAIGLALVTPSCARQDGADMLHALCAASLLLALTMTARAWRGWARLRHADDPRPAVTASDTAQADDRPRFLALVATLAGALSTLVIAALWLPVWLLAPCA